MAILIRILSTLVYAGNALLLLFGLYAYIWRWRFVTGAMAGPFWLFRAYDEGAVLLFYVAALGLAIFWVLRLFTRLLRTKMGADAERLFTALRVATILGAISAIPACDVNYNVLETKEFDNHQFHLVQVVDGNQVAYGVFRCQDLGSFYCQVISNDNRPWHGYFPAPPPTPAPLPTEVVFVEGEPVILEPRAPTATPPAAFLVNAYDLNGTVEQQLNVQIGGGLLGVAFADGTPEP
jgi:hypothetical protein